MVVVVVMMAAMSAACSGDALGLCLLSNGCKCRLTHSAISYDVERCVRDL